MKIGYIRVSTEAQNTARQEVLMEQLGVEKLFLDKASGKNTERKQLNELLDFIREGDEVIVESISRFARNTKDLLNLVDILTQKKVRFVSQKENIDTNTPTGQFMLTIFAAVATLERESILQRQAEGIAIAKQQGKYKGRKKIEHDNFKEIYSKWKSGEFTARKAMEILSMKPNTFYRRVKEYEKTM